MTTYNVYDGQTSSGVTIQYGDNWNVYYGGIVSKAVEAGEETIYAGGANVAGTLGETFGGGGAYLGQEYVSSGGVDEGSTIVAGDLYVASGAIIEGLTVSSKYSTLHLASGASVQGVTFLGGGEDLSDATISGVALSGAGLASLELQGSSYAANTYVYSGGYLAVTQSSTASGVTVYSGAELAAEQGSISSAIIQSGGVEYLYSATLTSNVLSAGATFEFGYYDVGSGQQLFLGTATTPVEEFGAMLSSGAVGTAGGNLYVLSGGVQLDGLGSVAFETVVSAGGVEKVLASGASLDSDVLGELIVSSGGAADYDDVYGSALLYGGASTLSCDLSGAETIIAGYVLDGVTVGGGALSALTVSQGASVTSAVVSLGGVLTVASGGTGLSASVSSGGGETILAGGTATNDTLLSGATVVDNGTLIQAVPASATVYLAATLSGSGSLVADGPGTLELGVATAFTGAVVLSGGSVVLERTGGIGKAPVDFEAASGTTTLDLKTGIAPTSGATFSSPLVDFNSASKRVDLTNTAYVNGATATLSGSTLVLKDGSYTASFTLGGAVASSYTVLSNGAGTLIEAATTQAAVKITSATPPSHAGPQPLIEASAAMGPVAGLTSTAAMAGYRAGLVFAEPPFLSAASRAPHPQ